MNFNEDHKVIMESLSDVEAEAYVEFLENEKHRHELAEKRAQAKAESLYALAQFYDSAAIRHHLDVVDIEKLVSRVTERFFRVGKGTVDAEY